MNRFEYLRKVYSKKWTVAREEYGTTDHEKVINEMIRVSKKWVVFDIMDATDHVVRRNHFIYRLKHPFKPKYEFEVNPDRIKKLGNFKEYKKDKPIFVFEKNS